MTGMKLFGLGTSRPQAEAISRMLGVPLGLVEEREFEDGEHKARPLESVADADVYVVHSLHADSTQSANDKICRLLFFLATARDHGAAGVTAVVPYLCYARKDRRTKPHDPITMRYVAQLFEAVRVDRVLVLDVHNPAAFENAFRCRVENVEARDLFADHLAPSLTGQEIVVISPDAGGFKRAEAFRRSLARVLSRPVDLGLMEKHRSAGVVSGEALFAQVAGRTVVIVDDLVSTGGTLLRTARAARAGGATSVIAVATHGLFVGDAGTALADPAIDRILITDSVPAFRLERTAAAQRVQVLPCASLFAHAIASKGAQASDDS